MHAAGHLRLIKGSRHHWVDGTSAASSRNDTHSLDHHCRGLVSAPHPPQNSSKRFQAARERYPSISSISHVRVVGNHTPKTTRNRVDICSNLDSIAIGICR